MNLVTSQISSFIISLESHPKAEELIPLVEQILNEDDISTESQLLAIFNKLCSDNPKIMGDLWFLKGSVLLEEGFVSRAASVFWKVVQIQPLEVSTWDRIIRTFISRKNFIYATFFLTKARSAFSDNSYFSSTLQQTSQQILINLRITPGIESANSLEVQNTRTPLVQKPSNVTLPSSFHNPWKMMLECFEGLNVSLNQKDVQSFVTYAHSAMRELLRLDGSFHDGLDQALIRLQLTHYKQPLMLLNRIRNQIAHANYIPSKKEVQNFYTLVREIVSEYKKHQWA